MEDFLEYYYNNTETIICPLGLLLRFNNTNKNDVLSFIIEKEVYSKIFNIEELVDIKKSMINPLIVEDNNKIINKMLIDVAKKYIEAVKLRMGLIDESILTKITSLNYDILLDDKIEIINKLKTNNVIKEYLPQVLENISLDINSYINETKLSVIEVTDIQNMVKELSIFKIVMANIYYLMDNKEQLENRFEEKYKDILEVDRIMFNKVNDITLEDNICNDFITLYTKINSLEHNLTNTIKELTNIKKIDLYDINDLYLNIVIKLDNNTIVDNDLYVFEKGQLVKVHEQNIYNKILDGIAVNKITLEEHTNNILKVLNKIDL